MLKSHTCNRCVAHFDPNADPDASAAWCGDCVREMKSLANEAEKYQNAIRSGDVNVRCESPEDARKNRMAIRRRYGHNPGNADTKMKTWRDKRKT